MVYVVFYIDCARGAAISLSILLRHSSRISRYGLKRIWRAQDCLNHWEYSISHVIVSSNYQFRDHLENKANSMASKKLGDIGRARLYFICQNADFLCIESKFSLIWSIVLISGLTPVSLKPFDRLQQRSVQIFRYPIIYETLDIFGLGRVFVSLLCILYHITNVRLDSSNWTLQ